MRISLTVIAHTLLEYSCQNKDILIYSRDHWSLPCACRSRSGGQDVGILQYRRRSRAPGVVQTTGPMGLGVGPHGGGSRRAWPGLDYLGSANDVDVMEDVLMRGKRMVPLVRGLKKGSRSVSGLDEFQALRSSPSELRDVLQETLDKLKKGEILNVGL
jgi:hypothetical protein